MSSITPASASSAAANQDTGASSTQNSLQIADPNVFLKLLVAQLQNQDPMEPMDQTTFMTQLAQFSQVETLLDIRSILTGIEGQFTNQSASVTPSA
jgi:flagellar basal-body rod modification protein FlgD